MKLLRTADDVDTLSKTESQVKAPACPSVVEPVIALGPVKYLANSTGLQTYCTLDTTTEKLWDETLDVNLKSMFLISQQVVPKIRESGGGGIVSISSMQGLGSIISQVQQPVYIRAFVNSGKTSCHRKKSKSITKISVRVNQNLIL